MNKYSVNIIGCGDIGFLFDHHKSTDGALTHFKAFNDSEHFEVNATAEFKKEIREIIRSDYGIQSFENYKHMCSEIRSDVIVIATNDESHFEILKDIVEFKPRLVFCEKPVTLNYDEAKEITELYGKLHIPLQINFTRRFLDEFDDIEKMITGNEIGNIESITFYYSRGLIHNASHYIDLLYRYIPYAEKVLLKVSVKPGISTEDDTVSFDMIYENGLEVRFIGLNPSKLSFAEVDFIGTEGRIKINYKNEIEKYKVTENNMYSGYAAYEQYDCRAIKFAKALPNAVENIYKALNGSEELKSPAGNSLRIFELINRIKEKETCQS